MTEFAWPLVVALGLVLGFIAAMRYLSRSTVAFADAASHVKLAEDFKAFTAAVEARTAGIDSRIARVEATVLAQTDNRLPPGLRGVR